MTTMPMNLQEVLDKVCERAKIPVKSAIKNSYGGERCYYRNPDGSGNHCFIGVCIPDDVYVPGMEAEGTAWSVYRVYSEVAALFDKSVDPEFHLQELQRIHDKYPPDMWPVLLKQFAAQNNLAWKD